MRFWSVLILGLWSLTAPAWAVTEGSALDEAVGRIERGAESWPPGAAKLDEAAALKASQAALGRKLRESSFVDHRGRAASVAGARGKALVISFIYTSCASVCPTITHSLERAVSEARSAFGPDSFEVWTIGFDTGFDTPEQMRRFASTQGVGESDVWRFLAGDLLNVVQLADDLGFMFFRSAKGFDHLSQVTVIDKDGVVYRQVYGDSFDIPHMVEPLKEIIFDRRKSVFTAEGLVKRVKFFCTVYDPIKDRYIFDYSIFIEASAGIVIMAVPIWVLVRHIWRNRRRRDVAV